MRMHWVVTVIVLLVAYLAGAKFPGLAQKLGAV